MVGILFLGMQSYKSLNSSRTLLTALRNKNESDKTHYEAIKEELLVNDQIVEKIDKFSKTWKPFLINTNDTNKIFFRDSHLCIYNIKDQWRATFIYWFKRTFFKQYITVKNLSFIFFERFFYLF